MKIFKGICLIILVLLFMFTTINILQLDIHEQKTLKPLKELIFISQNAMETTRTIINEPVNIKIIPEPHPFITSNSGKENNNVMHKYLAKYMYATSTNFSGDIYVRFTATHDIMDDRDIFIAINGKTIGKLLKGPGRCDTRYGTCIEVNNNFRENARELPIIGNNRYIFYVDITKKGTNINAFVAQNNNRIEEIYLYSN